MIVEVANQYDISGNKLKKKSDGHELKVEKILSTDVIQWHKKLSHTESN